MKILLSQDIPFKPSKFPINFSWVILITAIIGVLMSIPRQTMGVSVFTDYLIDAIGVISGFSMSWNVSGSALGPAIFSLSEQYEGNGYELACYAVLGISLVLLVLGLKANNTPS